MEPWGLEEVPHWELGAHGTQKNAMGWPTRKQAQLVLLEQAQRQAQRRAQRLATGAAAATVAATTAARAVAALCSAREAVAKSFFLNLRR